MPPKPLKRDQPNTLTARELNALPSVPASYQLPTIGKVAGSRMPANVVYTIGGGLMPSLPADPDLPKALSVTTARLTKNHRLANGLTKRADVMARLMARGASANAAYRAAYGHQGDPVAVASCAVRITRSARFNSAVINYRAVLENEARQTAVGVQDFVKSRLVHEAQSARNDGARIRALELLGKTEGMFVDVKRTEKTIDQASLNKAKAELNQRLKDTLKRMAPALFLQLQAEQAGSSHDTGTDSGNPPPEIQETEPHPGRTPLSATGPIPSSVDTIPPEGYGISTPDAPDGSPSESTPLGSLITETPPIGSPHMLIPLGEHHREMSIDDL